MKIDGYLTARLNRPSSHNDMTSMKNVMLEDDGRRAGAETKIPAEVAENNKKNPPTRLHGGGGGEGHIRGANVEICSRSRLRGKSNIGGAVESPQVTGVNTYVFSFLDELPTSISTCHVIPSKFSPDGIVHENLTERATHDMKYPYP